MVGALANASGTALRARTDTLECASAINHDGLDIYVARLELLALVRVLGLPVCDGAAEQLLETDGCLSLGKVQKIKRTVYLNSTDSVCNETHLTR